MLVNMWDITFETALVSTPRTILEIFRSSGPDITNPARQTFYIGIRHSFVVLSTFQTDRTIFTSMLVNEWATFGTTIISMSGTILEIIWPSGPDITDPADRLSTHGRRSFIVFTTFQADRTGCRLPRKRTFSWQFIFTKRRVIVGH